MSDKLEKVMAQAVTAHRNGELDAAAVGYRRVLDRLPGHPEALHLLGLITYQRGQFGPAIDNVRAAIANNPGQPLYHFNLGRILRDAGDRPAAIAAYGEALRLKPDYPEAAGNLATVLLEDGRLNEAVACLDALVCRRPNDPEAWVRLAALLADAALFADAARCFERALTLAPEHPVILYRYGGVLLRAGQVDAAQSVLDRAIAGNAGYAEAYNRLAAVHLARQQPLPAEAALQTALRLKPDLAEAWLNLAGILAERGESAATVMATYRRAGGLVRPGALAVLEALLVPPILAAEPEIDSLRAVLRDQLDRLLQADIRIDDPLHEIGRTSLFYLAYHGRCDRDIYEKAAALLRHVCPSLGFVAPHCRPAAPERAGRRIRLGFVSAYFCEHTIGNLFKGLIAGFDRQRFEVLVLFAPGIEDAVSRQIAAAGERSLKLPADLAAARATIAGLELDALVYPDVGMDPFTYFLAFARLAPLQCATWGHPATTGLPSIDVFLSSRHQERPEAQADYSEELVCLENPVYMYSRPSAPAPRRDQFAFGAGPLYLCPQSLFKLQPQFDPLLAGILRRDPVGRVAVPEGRFPQWGERLRERFRRDWPDVADRLVIYPRLAHTQYLSLLGAADVILDSLPFGGGLTTLDALAVGTPIVTLPGALMSSRFTSSCYERMGLADCIAASPADYLDKAVAIAGSTELRARRRASIAAASSILFDNPAPVRELETFFEARLRR